jgi:hypothetical protein
MVQAPDIGGAITRGLQGAQSLLAMRQMMEERERQKRLAPYEEQLAKLKLEAAPIELEAQRLSNQEKMQLMGIRGNYMAAQKLQPLIAQGKYDEAAQIAEKSKLFSDDQTKQTVVSMLKNRDTAGLVSAITSAENDALNFGVIKQKEAADVRTALEKNAEAAGFTPGTPEFRQFVRDQLAKPRGTQVTVTQGMQDLPAAVQTKINDLYDGAAKSELSSSNYLDLANRIGATQFGTSGVAAQVKDFFVNAVGGDDAETVLRQEFTRARNSEVIKAMPPGPQTDKDVAIFSEGIEKAWASPQRLQAFLRGAAKVESIQSQINTAKADWLSTNRSLSRAKEAFTSGDYDVAPGESFLDLQRRIVKSQNEIFSQQSMFPVTPQSPRPRQGMATEEIGMDVLNAFVPGTNVVPPPIPTGAAPAAMPGFTIRRIRQIGQ